MNRFFPLIFLFCATPLFAQFSTDEEGGAKVDVPAGREVVEIRSRDDGRGFSRQVGIVKSFDRNGLELETRDGTTSIAAHLVARIYYQKSNEQRLGDQHFRQKNFRDALAHYKKALSASDRRWIEVQITEQIIRCESALGFYAQAIQHFADLVELEPEMTDETFSCIPLVWQAIPGDGRAEETAFTTLKTHLNVPSVVVMSASYLLFSPRGKDLPQKLKVLAGNRETRVALLAEALTWRLNLMNVTPEEAASWRARLEAFPPELRAGPCFVVGQAFLRLKDYDSAALAFLKTAWVYTDSPILSQEAAKQAKKALELAGKAGEAEKVLSSQWSVVSGQ